MHVQNNNYIRLGDMHANTKLINIQTQIQTPHQIMKNQDNFSWSSFTPHPKRKIKSSLTYELLS